MPTTSSDATELRAVKQADHGAALTFSSADLPTEEWTVTPTPDHPATAVTLTQEVDAGTREIEFGSAQVDKDEDNSEGRSKTTGYFVLARQHYDLSPRWRFASRVVIDPPALIRRVASDWEDIFRLDNPYSLPDDITPQDKHFQSCFLGLRPAYSTLIAEHDDMAGDASLNFYASSDSLAD
ncbi:hypothetical protein RYH80_18750 [Halobaculum sp. MBLA0147]|uniref:hypothetical protein n=1 Tax=Halobaculum sp. MBLA0147 TaxID=3079934 RepID=UPI0035257C1E